MEQGRVVQLIHHRDGSVEQIRESTIVFDLSPERKSELLQALAKPEDIDRFSEPLIRSAHQRESK